MRMADPKQKEKRNSKTINGKNGNGKKRNKKIEEPVESTEPRKPPPPNVFLYIQLVGVKRLPQTINSLELHLSQGDNVIVKCDEHYNTSGIIYQDEFDSRPTFTLIVPQDNIERINDVSDNPLLVKLVMRITPEPLYEEEEEEEEVDENYFVNDIDDDDMNVPSNIINQIATDAVGNTGDNGTVDIFEEDYRLELISVGFIDLLKMFAKRRSLSKKELFLYPVPSVPNELRETTFTEWHLYTLLPLIREITIVNLAFITFESIYNVHERIRFDIDKLAATLKFRSIVPDANTKEEEIPLCEFHSMILQTIVKQCHYHVFDNIQLEGYQTNSVHGLQSTMEVELHMLFLRLMRSQDFEVDLENIDPMLDEAYVANSFHRYVLTKEMSNILFWVASCHKYIIAVDVYKASDRNIKIFEGILDPSVLAYPYVQSMRFAVPLQYVGPNLSRRSTKRDTTVSIQSEKQNRDPTKSPTFAIIKICLFSPIGEINEQLRVFNETFLSENRLLFCEIIEKEPYQALVEDVVVESYKRFDRFIEDTISYIISKCIHFIDERKSHFCCSLQNLRNILMAVIGADFNHRKVTKDNLEFTNLCVDAYNELELRVHERVELFNSGGFTESAFNYKDETELIIDYMNAVKFLHEVNEMTMADLILEKIKNETKITEVLNFFLLIDNMERQRYEEAKEYFKENTIATSSNYFAGWIKVYLDYLDNMSNEETEPNALEFLLRDISIFSEMNSKQIDGWILLYCYYKRHNYLPGMDYARWRYTDYMHLPRDSTAGTPYSLSGIYLSHVPEFKTRKSEVFFEVVRVFQRLGLYDFAKIVFETIKNDCREVDRYLINNSLDILSKTLNSSTGVRSFPTDNSESGVELAGFINQTNGNIEYYRENYGQAKNYFENNVDQPVSSTDRDFFLLSKIRLAYTAFNNEDYMNSIRALSKPIAGNILTCISYYMIGRSYYKLGDMKNALNFFSKSTTIKIHIPDIWGYLALINIRMQNIHNALECWKYAKIDPVNVISDEIYNELDEIDYDEVDLYIDIPNIIPNDLLS